MRRDARVAQRLRELDRLAARAAGGTGRVERTGDDRSDEHVERAVASGRLGRLGDVQLPDRSDRLERRRRTTAPRSHRSSACIAASAAPPRPTQPRARRTARPRRHCSSSARARRECAEEHRVVRRRAGRAGRPRSPTWRGVGRAEVEQLSGASELSKLTRGFNRRAFRNRGRSTRSAEPGVAKRCRPLVHALGSPARPACAAVSTCIVFRCTASPTIVGTVRDAQPSSDLPLCHRCAGPMTHSSSWYESISARQKCAGRLAARPDDCEARCNGCTVSRSDRIYNLGSQRQPSASHCTARLTMLYRAMCYKPSTDWSDQAIAKDIWPAHCAPFARECTCAEEYDRDVEGRDILSWIHDDGLNAILQGVESFAD